MVKEAKETEEQISSEKETQTSKFPKKQKPLSATARLEQMMAEAEKDGSDKSER